MLPLFPRASRSALGGNQRLGLQSWHGPDPEWRAVRLVRRGRRLHAPCGRRLVQHEPADADRLHLARGRVDRSATRCGRPTRRTPRSPHRRNWSSCAQASQPNRIGSAIGCTAACVWSAYGAPTGARLFIHWTFHGRRLATRGLGRAKGNCGIAHQRLPFLPVAGRRGTFKVYVTKGARAEAQGAALRRQRQRPLTSDTGRRWTSIGRWSRRPIACAKSRSSPASATTRSRGSPRRAASVASPRASSSSTRAIRRPPSTSCSTGKLETTREVAGEQVLMFSHGPGRLPRRHGAAHGHAVSREHLRGRRHRPVRARRGGAAPARVRPPHAAAPVPAGVRVGQRRRSRASSATARSCSRSASSRPGLAHELNNPAAAAARAVSRRCASTSARATRPSPRSPRTGAAAEQLAALVALGAEAAEQARPGERLDPLAESDREEELLEALEQRGVPDGARARGGVDGGAASGRLDRAGRARSREPRDSPPACASWRRARARAGADAELEEATTTRIVGLVAAVRNYSYLDQAPRQTVVIHEGLESTLALLAHKLRAKQIEVVREFDPDLPTVEASGSELNQVWTNLIDNAIDAVDDARAAHPAHAQAGPADLRRGLRQRAAASRADAQDARLRRLLHDQAGRPGHGPRPRHRPAHRGARPRRAAPGVEPGDTRFQVLLPVD